MPPADPNAPGPFAFADPARVRSILGDAGFADIELHERDFDYFLGADMDEAIDHIERYGSHHTDAIVTEDLTRARRFLREVDSSSVMVNASTRLADGFEFGRNECGRGWSSATGTLNF